MNTARMRILKSVPLYVFLTIAAILVAFPVFWILSISLRPNNEVITFPPRLLPQTFTLDAYKQVIESKRYVRYFINSYIVGFAVTIISVVIAIFTAYGFSRYDFRGNKAMNLFIVATQTIPRIALVIPYFIFITQLKLYDTYQGLIITFTSFTLPYAILMLTGYFNSIPADLDDAVVIE